MEHGARGLRPEAWFRPDCDSEGGEDNDEHATWRGRTLIFTASLPPFWSKNGVKSTCMLEFEFDYGIQELIIRLRDDENTCMSLHVTCMLHASRMH